MDGADGSITFTDESGKSWGAGGTAQIDTAQYKFGGASGLFDGNSDYLETADNDDFYFTGAWTIDFWVRFASLSGYQTILSQYVDTNNQLQIRKDDVSNSLLFYIKTGGTVRAQINTSSAAFSATDTWYHVALVWDGATFYIFINGTSVSLTTITAYGVPGDIAATVIIAGYVPVAYYLNGWLDEFRWSKGIARWTANFTPPTREYGGGGQVIIWSSE